MRRLAKLFLCFGLIASGGCGGDPAPKSGVMPGVATGGYDAPTNTEATMSYMLAFERRYNIPALEYPKDIEARIEQARFERFKRDMRKAQYRSQMKAQLALMVMNDPEAKEILEQIQTAKTDKAITESIDELYKLLYAQRQRSVLTDEERDKIYQKTLIAYKRHFRGLKIEECRWTEMKRLYGSGHEQMALIHGDHPTHGYDCQVDLIYEKNRGYPRKRSFTAFWVKDKSGEWDYFGNFHVVGLKPRRQQLNPDLLRDPEGTIKRRSTMDMITSSFSN